MNTLFAPWELANHSASPWHIAAWTMCYFLVFGTSVAVLGATVRFLCNRTAPALRYAISLATFAAMSILPVGIALWLAQSPQSMPTLAAPSATIDLAEFPEFTQAPKLGTEPIASPTIPVQTQFAITNQPIQESDAAWLIAYFPWLWIAGAPITFVLLATGLVGSERLRRRCEPVASGIVIEASRRAHEALNITRRVGVVVCDRISQPVLVGILRPLILLPPAAIVGWSPEELEMVLLHELAHVRRWDNLVNLAQRLVESLLFFHPAIWLVSRQVRHDREQCCDAVVVRHTAAPQAYAELLVNIAAKGSSTPSLATASAMADHPLTSRIRRILKLEDEPMLVSRRTLGFFTLFAASIVVIVLWQPADFSVADEPDAPGKLTATIAENLAEETFDLEIGFPKKIEAEDPQRIANELSAQGFKATLLEDEKRDGIIRKMVVKIPKDIEPNVNFTMNDRGKFVCNISPRRILIRYSLLELDRVPILDWSKIVSKNNGATVIWDKTIGNDIVVKATRKQHKQITKLLDRAREFTGNSETSPTEAESLKISPNDQVYVRVDGEFPDQPIDNIYRVGPNGTLALGPTYGRVKVLGKTLQVAEIIVTEHLENMLSDVAVQISWHSTKRKSTTLLYDGKTFEQWREMWKTELKVEKRTECVNALAAFARAGHAKEAAETILDVAGEYDFTMIDSSAEGKLKQRVLDILSKQIPASLWLTPLLERYGADEKKWNKLADWLLGSLYRIDESERQQLLEIANSDHSLRKTATRVLIQNDTDFEHAETIALARKALQGKHPDTAVLYTLGYRRLDQVPEQFDLLFHKDRKVRHAARSFFSNRSIPEGIQRKLLHVLYDPDQSEKHPFAIRAISAPANYANPGPTEDLLLRIAREGDKQLLGAAMFGLTKVLNVSNEAVLKIVVKEDLDEDRKKLVIEDGYTILLQEKFHMTQGGHTGGGFGGRGGGGQGGGGGFF